mmetsp:Transcript_13204/g.28648  ORF Transcript_13204/g.28648 Transcript_13204/m.28648 type:complete len:209 (+) Transcript_13204:2589-3215(+)
MFFFSSTMRWVLIRFNIAAANRFPPAVAPKSYSSMLSLNDLIISTSSNPNDPTESKSSMVSNKAKTLACLCIGEGRVNAIHRVHFSINGRISSRYRESILLPLVPSRSARKSSSKTTISVSFAEATPIAMSRKKFSRAIVVSLCFLVSFLVLERKANSSHCPVRNLYNAIEAGSISSTKKSLPCHGCNAGFVVVAESDCCSSRGCDKR